MSRPAKQCTLYMLDQLMKYRYNDTRDRGRGKEAISMEELVISTIHTMFAACT
jgi:hypothetical protein